MAIHDGVRPLVSESTISAVYKEAEKSGACVPVIKLRQSARIITETKSEAIDRNNLRIVQTPQCFHSTLIKKAYRSSYQPHFTDDATVLESTGQQVSLIEGNVENIKITFQSDLKIAESLLDNI